jgi:cytosine/adenosine deaminase-related metal-dependent hydrolase
LTPTRFLSATEVVTVASRPVPDGVIVLGADGTVMDVLRHDDPNLGGREVEHHDGLLCPGFVNAHCHLELSHLHKKIGTGTGLPGFLKEVVNLRAADSDSVNDAMLQADRAMYESGTMAVGDISNHGTSAQIKAHSPIHYHTYIEAFAFTAARSQPAIQEVLRVAGSFTQNCLPFSIVPHAPYSLHPQILSSFLKIWGDGESPLTIHNQECAAEDEMFLTGKGALIETFIGMGVPMEEFVATGLPSLRSYLGQFPTRSNVTLVHNTYMAQQELRWAMANHRRLFLCACPRANLYIEGRVPDVMMWIDEGAKVCIGTDSLASNNNLSMVDEINTLMREVRQLRLHQVLAMATMNGAEALGLDQELGSIEKGKRPGVVLIKRTGEVIDSARLL